MVQLPEHLGVLLFPPNSFSKQVQLQEQRCASGQVLLSLQVHLLGLEHQVLLSREVHLLGIGINPQLGLVSIVKATGRFLRRPSPPDQSQSNAVGGWVSIGYC